MYAYLFEVTPRYRRMDYLKTTVEFAIQRPDQAKDFYKFLKEEVPKMIEECDNGQKPSEGSRCEERIKSIKPGN